MSFLDFTLYPHGGAFMMCESISEFDENIPTPKPPENIAAAVQSAAEHTNNDILYTEPVAYVRLELAKVFNGPIKSILTMPLDYHDAMDKAEAFHALCSYMKEIVEPIQRITYSLIGLCNLVGTEYEQARAYIYEPIKSNLGFFIKNASRIREEGYGTVNLSDSNHPAICSYNARRTFSHLLHSKDVLKDHIIDNQTLDTFDEPYNSNKITNYCTDIMDLLNTIFNNPEKFLRQEVQSHSTNDISDIIRYQIDYSPEEAHNRPVDCCSHDCISLQEMMRCISHMVRKIATKSYNVQVNALDNGNENSDTDINKDLFHMGTFVVNMFIISVMTILYFAYICQNAIREYNYVSIYVADVMRNLK